MSGTACIYMLSFFTKTLNSCIKSVQRQTSNKQACNMYILSNDILTSRCSKWHTTHSFRETVSNSWNCDMESMQKYLRAILFVIISENNVFHLKRSWSSEVIMEWIKMNKKRVLTAKSTSWIHWIKALRCSPHSAQKWLSTIHSYLKTNRNRLWMLLL